MTMLPSSGLSSPIRHLRNTDLPVPDGPSITQISPAGMVSVTSPQMSCFPNDLVRWSTWISTPTALSSAFVPDHPCRVTKRTILTRDEPTSNPGERYVRQPDSNEPNLGHRRLACPDISAMCGPGPKA